MVKLEMSSEEAGILLRVLENYTAHLDVEIHRTERHEFREALEQREKVLHGIVDRIGKAKAPKSRVIAPRSRRV